PLPARLRQRRRADARGCVARRPRRHAARAPQSSQIVNGLSISAPVVLRTVRTRTFSPSLHPEGAFPFATITEAIVSLAPNAFDGATIAVFGVNARPFRQ